MNKKQLRKIIKEEIQNLKEAKMNNKDYKFYTVIVKRNGKDITPLINGGWEYREDAKDDMTDNQGFRGATMKVYTLKHLKNQKIDPNDNSNWGNF